MRRPKNALTIIIVWIALLCSFSAKAQQFSAEISVAKDTFIVGDSIGIKINIQTAGNHIYKLRKIPQLQGLEWLDSSSLQKEFSQNPFVLTVTGFDSGRFTFPSLVFDILNTDNGTVAAARTQNFPIHITYAKVDTTQAIKPIKAPMEVDYDPIPIWLYILLAAVILALAYFLYKKWKKKQQKPAEPTLAAAEKEENKLLHAEEAIKQIQQLQQEEKLHNEQQYWFGLKEILRTYIHKNYNIRTQEKTSSQILGALRKKDIERADIYTLDRILNQADLVIFATDKPEPKEKDTAAQNAVSFIKATMPKTGENTADEEKNIT